MLFGEQYPDLQASLLELRDSSKLLRKKALLQLEQSILEHSAVLAGEDKEWID